MPPQQLEVSRIMTHRTEIPVLQPSWLPVVITGIRPASPSFRAKRGIPRRSRYHARTYALRAGILHRQSRQRLSQRSAASLAPLRMTVIVTSPVGSPLVGDRRVHSVMPSIGRHALGNGVPPGAWVRMERRPTRGRSLRAMRQPTIDSALRITVKRQSAMSKTLGTTVGIRLD
jgi:hypothetical protein